MSFPLLEKPLFQVGGHYVTFLGLIAFAALFAAGVIISRFLQSDVVRRLFSHFKIDTNFIAIVTTILSLAAIVFFTVAAINAAGIPLAWNAALPAIKLSLLQIFLLVTLLIAVFWISSRTKRFLFNRLLAQSGLDRSLQYAIAQVVSNIVLVVGIFIVLENSGIRLAALTVFAGAVGVGVGFGLQNIASNFISGLVILAERPITIGDRVEVAGIAGQVEHIRARSTVIRTNDNIMMIVPNTKFIDSPVTNWTYGDRRVRFRIPVGVAYGSDVAKVRDALLAVAQENPHTLKEPAPGVFLEKFGDNSIDFKLVVWSSEMSARPSRYRSDLNFAIVEKFREAKIEMPFPQRDLHIRSGTLKVENVTEQGTTKRRESADVSFNLPSADSTN
ncbi:MAG: mechanosensitive ion channel protein MscS [Verrucomicrobia bacterium]|nr:MAG: mechanosensitive ion channel protein MscS [Verrucomicrobiota bacterium]PYK48542.1 MAG: mechanosensitive ion channel protein MscS [Verrucomicrobiota bacterium]PYL43937.1 MAG: mechanosensitive ion channel protein MscS [Verrucomicrobiota bacterium]